MRALARGVGRHIGSRAGGGEEERGDKIEEPCVSPGALQGRSQTV